MEHENNIKYAFNFTLLVYMRLKLKLIVKGVQYNFERNVGNFHTCRTPVVICAWIPAILTNLF
jgi:hypothetical protein